MIDSSFCKKILKDEKKLGSTKILSDRIRNLSIPRDEQIVSCYTGLNSIGGASVLDCKMDIQEISTNEGIKKNLLKINDNYFNTIGSSKTRNLLHV